MDNKLIMKKRIKFSSKKEYQGRIKPTKGINDLESKGNKEISHRLLRAKLKEEVRQEALREIEDEKNKVKVNIIESERGWGRSICDTKTFETMEKALAFIKEFNQKNVDDWNKTHVVPDYYVRAEIGGDIFCGRGDS